jgi:hypothetical protein
VRTTRQAAWVTMVSVVALAGCATADLRPGIVRHETPKQIWSKFHGPSVQIRAYAVATQNARMIQPHVSLGDSAWLVIGDIGDDGTLRIIYPTRPSQQHVVTTKGGFDGPRFQPRVILPFFTTAFSTARTAPGITFVIASSSPLNLSKLADGDRWSVFDVYYDNHTVDPRPAITDLAAEIATNIGDISISYTPYAWGFVGPRSGVSQRSTPTDLSPGSRRRLPRPPI